MSDDDGGSSGASPSGRPFGTLRTLVRAARWETFAILAVLLVLVFVFS